MFNQIQKYPKCSNTVMSRLFVESILSLKSLGMFLFNRVYHKSKFSDNPGTLRWTEFESQYCLKGRSRKKRELLCDWSPPLRRRFSIFCSYSKDLRPIRRLTRFLVLRFSPGSTTRARTASSVTPSWPVPCPPSRSRNRTSRSSTSSLW